MRKLALFIVALSLIIFPNVTIGKAGSENLCARRPDHKNCQPAATPTPTPVATPTPTPILTPTPTISPTPTPIASSTPNVTPTPTPTSTPPASVWTLIFEDQFTTLDKGRYAAYPCCWGDTRYKQGDTVNGGIYTGTDRMFHDAANGILELRLYRDATNQPRSINPSPRLPSGNNHQLYGKYEIKFKATQSVGWKTAWLLWPQSEVWPRDGEIDFPEGDLNKTISAFMHRQGATSGSDQDVFNTTSTYANWHTAIIEWTPNSVKFFLDGQLIGHSASRVPNTPMRWQIQTETSLDRSTIPSANATVYIDYLKVWSYTP